MRDHHKAVIISLAGTYLVGRHTEPYYRAYYYNPMYGKVISHASQERIIRLAGGCFYEHPDRWHWYEWVSTEQELPEQDAVVLLKDEGGGVYRGVWNGKVWVLEDGEGRCTRNWFTHWKYV